MAARRKAFAAVTGNRLPLRYIIGKFLVRYYYFVVTIINYYAFEYLTVRDSLNSRYIVHWLRCFDFLRDTIVLTSWPFASVLRSPYTRTVQYRSLFLFLIKNVRSCDGRRVYGAKWTEVVENVIEQQVVVVVVILYVWGKPRLMTIIMLQFYCDKVLCKQLDWGQHHDCLPLHRNQPETNYYRSIWDLGKPVRQQKVKNRWDAML